MRVLILCTGNSARSQMAEGILRALDPRLEVYSAGTEPAARVNPFAVEAMRRIGIDISAARPKHVREFLGQPFDYVITVCGEAERNCPAFSGEVRRRLHLGFPDPAAATGSDEEKLEVFERIRDAIGERFRSFYEQELRNAL
jgi:arsenate reductase